MTIRATQPIASAFGSYMPGDEITQDAAGPVLNAWLAAGIAIEEEATVVETPQPEKRETPQPDAPIERAITPQRETTAGRQQAPHRRFVQDVGKG